MLIICILRYWQTRTPCCGNIVAHDVSLRAQTGKHLLRKQNVSEQNHKHFLCPGHKIYVRNKCCARGQTGKHLCRQQCVLVYQYLYCFCVCRLMLMLMSKCEPALNNIAKLQYTLTKVDAFQRASVVIF